MAALALAISCTSAPVPAAVPADTAAAPKLAREAGAILLHLSAYDHAHAGGLSGERERVVDGRRYAVVAREALGAISVVSRQTVAAAAGRAGPTRDRLLSLGDLLAAVGRDLTAYAESGDAAAFARVVVRVDSGWARLSDLAAALPPDEALAATIARGRSFEVATSAHQAFGLSVGPFATRAEAEAAAGQLGRIERLTAEAPFVIRVATYGDRASADAGAASLAARGLRTTVTDEMRSVFSRRGPWPDRELWREPVRVIDTAAGARRVAIASDGAWLATGSDDGTVAIFSGQGTLGALPKFNAGIAHLAFSDDGAWLLAGGLTLANLGVPAGASPATPLRLPAPATQTLFVPAARAFAAATAGATGGVIVGRRADGAELAPFPIRTPPGDVAIAATSTGDLYIATSDGRGGTDIEVLKVAAGGGVRQVARVPGAVRQLAIDPSGALAAALTDEAVVRFSPREPHKTLSTLPLAAREIAFGADGTLHVLEPTRLSAFSPDGSQRFAVPLVDGRRLVVARRTLVLDGSERLVAVDAAGVADELGIGGVVQDVSASADGARVAVIVDGWRAAVFALP